MEPLVKKHNPLISVIVPIYNVEAYLRRCLDSLLAQTYRNLEILLVDDGSTDNSGRICDEYAAKDSRVKVIHQKNQGAHCARNAGLAVATGDYIGSVDGDDHIKPEMYETLLSDLLKKQADVSMCAQIVLKQNGEQKLDLPREKEYVYTNNAEWLKDLMVHAWTYHVWWNKLFTRHSIGKVRFNPKTRNTGDFEFLLDILHQPLRISYIPQPLYYYLMRDTSLTHQPSPLFYEGRYHAWKRAVKVARKMQKDEPFAWLDDVYRNKFIPLVFKLTIFLVLFDKKNEYHKNLREMQYLSRHLQKSPIRFSFTPLRRIWTYCFGNFPKFTIAILRLPGIRQMAGYYICHR